MDVEKAFKTVGACGRYQAFLFMTIAMGSIFMAFQMVCLVFVAAETDIKPNSRMQVKEMTSIVGEWNLTGDRKYIADLIQSIFMGGVLIGNVSIGMLSDRFGRKPVYFKVLIILIFTSFVTTFANDWRIFAALRFIAGVCQGGVVLVGFVLAQELLGSSVWTISGNLIQGLFSVGIIILAALASVFTNWRHLFVVISVPGLFLLLNYRIMPESPRWLYSQGKVAAAEEALQYLARKNGRRESVVKSIVLERKPQEKKTRKTSYGFSDLFSSKNLAKRTLVMAYVWFVCSFTYYGLTMGAKDLAKSLYVSVALSGVVEIPAMLLCVVLLNRPWAGRRRTLVGFMAWAAVSCSAIMLLHDASQKTTGRTVLALGGKLAITAAFSLIYIYASELYPTVVRNVGMGSSSMCARMGGMAAPYVHTLEIYGASTPYILYGGVAFVASLLVLLLPETLNRPVPDTLDDVKGEPDTGLEMKKTRMRARHNDDQMKLLIDPDDDADTV